MVAAAKTAASDEVAEVTQMQSAPAIKVGDSVFTCQPKHLPIGTLMKYAENDLDLVGMHHLVVKLVHPDQIDDFWDALDEVGIDEGMTAIQEAIAEYTRRPTKRA